MDSNVYTHACMNTASPTHVSHNPAHMYIVLHINAVLIVSKCYAYSTSVRIIYIRSILTKYKVKKTIELI